MLREDTLSLRITVNPHVMVGKPTIRGLRITVEQILRALAGGVSRDDLLDDYPQLEPEDIEAALITDGRFSGGTRGLCIGHVSPEAAAGGEIGLLNEGDIIEIDVHKKSINAKISDQEFEKRRKKMRPFTPKVKGGWLARYSAFVSSADTGAVLLNLT